MALPDLTGFAGDPPIVGAVEFIGDASLPIAVDAFLVVHTTPDGDHVVDHLLHGSSDLFVDPSRPSLRHDIVAVELIDLKLDLVNLLRARRRARLRGIGVLAMRMHGLVRRNRS